MRVTPSRTVVWTTTTRESVADRVVEPAEGDGVLGGVGGIEHPAAPEGVVGDDESAESELGQHRLEVDGVPGLVRIEEDQVEGARQPGDRLDCRPHHHLDAVRIGTGRDVAAGEFGMDGRDLTGGDGAAGGQPGSHREGGVPAERPDLEDRPGAHREGQQLEEPSFEPAHHHPGCVEGDPQLGGQRLEMGRGGRRVL